MKQHGRFSSVITILMVAALSAGCGGKDDEAAPQPPVVPPVAIGTAQRLVALTTTLTPVALASAQGTGKLAVNMETGAVGGSILFSGLTSSTIGASIRDGSAAGTPAVVTLESGTGKAGAWLVPETTVLDTLQLSALANGGYFLRVDTVNNQGELRGDIVFPEITITTPLTPLSGTGSAGSGLGALTVNLGTGVISGTLTFSGLTSNATAGHIHLRSDNSVIITLTGGAGAQAGTFTVPAGAFLNEPQLKALVNDGLYFAVHSQNFQPPSTELVGNIAYPVATIPAVSLSGAQETPPVTTVGSGSGSLTISLGTGKISGTVAFNTPSIAADAHIHRGFAGENGPLLVTLSGGTGLTTGTWNIPADTFLTAERLGALISDRLYLNIHTASTPTGEIRGQIVNVPTN